MNPASGGPCQGIRNSIPALKKLGVHNEVVSLDPPNAPFLQKDEFPIHAVGPAENPWAYNGRLHSWLLANFSRFDVVIVHGLWLYHGFAVRKAINKYQKNINLSGSGKVPKLFVMPHGMLDPYFQKAAGRKLKAIRNWVYWKLVEGKVVNDADGILFTCEEELLLARTTFKPYSPKKELNIGYGIASPAAYSPEMKKAFLKKCPEIKNEPFLLFLSRIHEKKGVELLIKAFKLLVEKMTSKKHTIPKLVIAGPGLETAYGQQLQKLVSSSTELSKLVYFPGMLTGNAKWGAFYGCEAFVLPSHQENFGIAVVEALACGKPVLISNQVNIWREMERGGGGIVADDSLSGIMDLLEAWLKKSKKERQEMNQKARLTFEKKFAIGPASSQLYHAISE